MPRIRLAISTLTLTLLSVFIVGGMSQGEPSSLPSLEGDQAIESLAGRP